MFTIINTLYKKKYILFPLCSCSVVLIRVGQGVKKVPGKENNVKMHVNSINFRLVCMYKRSDIHVTVAIILFFVGV